jgi:hypothetical protein
MTEGQQNLERRKTSTSNVSIINKRNETARIHIEREVRLMEARPFVDMNTTGKLSVFPKMLLSKVKRFVHLKQCRTSTILTSNYDESTD